MKKILLALAALFVVVFIALNIGNPSLPDPRQDPPDTFKWLNEMTPEGQAVIKYSFAHIPCLADFQRIYPRSSLTIWPSFPKHRATSLSFETILYGRYDVTLEQNIATDRKTLSAKPIDGPRLGVAEITLLIQAPDTSWTTSWNTGHEFGPAEWTRLLESHGDLSSIMTGIDKDHPLPLAEKYLQMVESESVLPK